ncbi:peptide/nickel transport system ATP-binding protein [Pedococcus dokdonensis]|uniref:Peptide/nickel transport system ATP-binding protein n=1 Tax=Pedococcus dokdonensis TaxID=443156 RepID=A0A1H0SK46_9MICO|nr:ABC transporter ATP-binding protein [Pedococcus dokdonensis]SDP42087.1 peptide/nickel transport system ATP-binding protein [Pedococcus dokdonensis]
MAAANETTTTETTTTEATDSTAPGAGTPLLRVRDLSVRFEPKTSPALTAVDQVSFDLAEGEFVGLIGESGSGKSTLAMALLSLLEKPGRVSGGTIEFDGEDLASLSPEELRSRRWRDIATVFQSSMNSLNPVMRVAAQFRDVIEEHSDLRGDAVTERVRDLFEMVMIDPKFMSAYPHELSGGMKQRVNLALALANRPRFVLLDEPTTGLDVVVQRSILEAVRRLQKEQGFAVLFISHDIGTVMELSDRIFVMYAGRLVEQQPAATLVADPLHPYSKGLLGSYSNPRADTVRVTYIPGRPPDLTRRVEGCRFAARCPEAIERCATDDPALLPLAAGRVACHVAHLQRGPAQDRPVDLPEPTLHFDGPEFVKTAEDSARARRGDVFLQVDGVTKVFERRKGFTRQRMTAVDDVSFQLRKGEVTALVGQSGSGKTTLARMITGVDKPTSGTIHFSGSDGEIAVERLRSRQLRGYRKHVQMVFQDPYSSLNPALTLRYTLSRPLRNHRGLGAKEAEAVAGELLETVALTPSDRFLDRYPYELSGGQRQRVVIARALAANPELIVADEPISSLDVSIRAEILELLQELVTGHDIGVLYITHDLLSARLLADEILVLSEGRVVEQGPALEVIRNPGDAYTQRLLDAIPNPFEQAATAG